MARLEEPREARIAGVDGDVGVVGLPLRTLPRLRIASPQRAAQDLDLGDAAAEASRQAVAAYLGLDAVHLSGVPVLIVEIMAARLEGNRARARTLAAALRSRRD